MNLFCIKVDDLIGRQVNRWKALSYSGKNSRGESLLLCECACKSKTIRKVSAASLRDGSSFSCGCYRLERLREVCVEDLLNSPPFGKLTVIRRGPKTVQGFARWVCLCECGRETLSSASNLKRGNSKSCGYCATRRLDQPDEVAGIFICIDCHEKKPFSQRREPNRNQCQTCTSRAVRALNYRRRLENPARHIYQNVRRNAKAKGREFSLSEATIATMLEEAHGSCPCCKKPITNEVLATGKQNPRCAGVDCFNPALGYVEGNVSILCWRCNFLKSNGTYSEFVSIVSAWRSILDHGVVVIKSSLPKKTLLTWSRVKLYGVRQRAKIKKIYVDLDAEFLVSLYTDTCPVFGIPLVCGTNIGGKSYASPSLDRIDPAGGYVRDNVWIISDRANTLKGNSSIQELEAIVVWMEHILAQQVSLGAP